MSRSPRPMVVALAGLSALVVLLSGCTSAEGPASTQSAAVADSSIRVAQPTAAAELLQAEPERVVIDVRTPEEFTQGHLEGAVLVDYNAPDFEERIAEFDRDASYLIYCRSGNRSAGARQVMEELGFTDVVDVAGGITAWNGAGLPVTTA